MPHVVVRADADASLGAGHVVRCLSIAAELLGRGVAVTFVTRAPDGLADRIAATGARIARLPGGSGTSGDARRPWPAERQQADLEHTRSLLDGPADLTIVDHYGLDHRWEHGINGPVLVIDDLADRRHVCAALVDQNWYGPDSGHRYDGLADGAILLLGPRYALLQPEYRERRRSLVHNWPPRRVLVSFGGTDASAQTTKAVRALVRDGLAGVEVDVVVGSPDRVTDELAQLARRHPSVDLHVAVPSLAPLLAHADLAIGAAGSGTWERLCMNVPAIVVTTSMHQSGVTAALHAHQQTVWLGVAADTTEQDYRRAFLALQRAPRPAVAPLVDGWGARRVANWIAARVGGAPAALRLRASGRDDAASILGVRAEAAGTPTTGWAGGVFATPEEWAREVALPVAADDPATSEPWVVEAAGCPVGIATQRNGRLEVVLDRSTAAVAPTGDLEGLAPSDDTS